jgi:hypothetical protein
VSILTHGFLYLPNGTTIHQRLYRSLDLTVTDIESGMICFTDTDWDKSHSIRDRFGQFGIVVDNNWAFDNGARRVAYIAESGPIFDSLKQLLVHTTPTDEALNTWLSPHMGKGAAKKIAAWLRSDPDVARFQMPPLYSLILDMLQWVEIDNHKEEQEFRIRSPTIGGAFSEKSRQEQVQMILSAIPQFPECIFSLSITRDKLQFLCCERRTEDALRSAVMSTDFVDVPIKCYS